MRPLPPSGKCYGDGTKGGAFVAFVRTLTRVMPVTVICCCFLTGCGKNPTPIPNGFTPLPVPSATPSGSPIPIPGQAWQFQGWGISLAWWTEIVGDWGQPAEQQTIVQALFGNPATPNWPVIGGTSVPPLGLTVLRYNVGASPASGASDSCQPPFRLGAEVPTVQAGAGQAVRLTADPGQFGVLKAAYDLIQSQDGHPDVEAFANSPPYWLVPGGCPQGTDGPEDLSQGAQSQYVSYLTAVVAGLQADGITVSSAEPFNEPTTPWPNGCSSGCQEGAGFSLDTQQSILSKLCHVLPPGITVAAPDGASPEDTIGAWQTYLRSMPCVGQINTHSYQGGPAPYVGPYRPALATFARDSQRQLWMSEFGSSSPITVATQIADDLNQLRPDAWIYWTAMEGPQGWGLLDDPLADGSNASAADPGIGRVSATKRYFALAQFTRFIRPGDKIIPVSASYPSGVRIVVAATAASGLVVVAVNPDQTSEPLSFDLGSIGVGTNVAATVYRTDASSASDNDTELSAPASVLGGLLVDTLPPMSVSTYVVGAPAAGRVYAAPGGFPPAAPQTELRYDYQPTAISLSGDGSYYLEDLTWPVWNSTEAVAHGIASVDNCRPSCAQGHEFKDPMIATFTDPRSCGGNLFWSRALIHYTGAVPPDDSQNHLWSQLFYSC